MWEWAEEEEEEKQQELRILSKQGCVEQMLGAGVDICFIKSCLAWILKWRTRGMWEAQKAWMAETKSPVCLHFLVVFRKIHRQSIQKYCVTDSPVSFHLCQSLLLRSWPPVLFKPLGIGTNGCHPPLLVCAAPARSHHLLWWWQCCPRWCYIFPLFSSSLHHLLVALAHSLCAGSKWVSKWYLIVHAQTSQG